MLKGKILIPVFFLFLSPNYSALSAEENATNFGYHDYAAVLKTYVNVKGGVDYRGLASIRSHLILFLDRAARLEKEIYEKWSDTEKIAYLLNIYNALTLKLIVDHIPIQKTTDEAPDTSIRQIPDAWDKTKFNAAGTLLSLNEIENDVLRVQFDEPRIHMALVCAAWGCPPLRQEPYLPQKLYEQLADQTKRFLKDPKKFKIDRKSGKLHLSQIFNWFGKDFLKSFGTEALFPGKSNIERAVLNFISGYIDPEDARYLKEGDYEIQYLDYDWTLNDQ